MKKCSRSKRADAHIIHFLPHPTYDSQFCRHLIIKSINLASCNGLYLLFIDPPCSRYQSASRTLIEQEKPGKKRPVLNLQPCVMDSCLFGAESSLRLLAGTLFPQAPEPLRFDSWPRHGSIGLKIGQNLILSFPVKKPLLVTQWLYADRTFLPLRRRAANTLRPLAVAIRARKP